MCHLFAYNRMAISAISKSGRCDRGEGRMYDTAKGGSGEICLDT